jgi:hypothetical protein
LLAGDDRPFNDYGSAKCPGSGFRSPVAFGLEGAATKLEKVENSRPTARQTPRRSVEQPAVFGHHGEEIFRVPERFENRAGLLQPFFVRPLVEIMLGPFAYDLAVPFTGRIFLAADCRDQRRPYSSTAWILKGSGGSCNESPPKCAACGFGGQGVGFLLK